MNTFALPPRGEGYCNYCGDYFRRGESVMNNKEEKYHLECYEHKNRTRTFLDKIIDRLFGQEMPKRHESAFKQRGIENRFDQQRMFELKIPFNYLDECIISGIVEVEDMIRKYQDEKSKH